MRKERFSLRFCMGYFKMGLSAERSDGDWTNKYRLVRTLKERKGTGVYLAEHIRLKRLCVIKTIRGSTREKNAILGEAASLKQLQHSGIPKIYDIEEEENGFSIVEEYIQGESLTSYCLSGNSKKEEIISFMIQLCDLLAYLHKRTPPLLHLDLKPDNLLVNDGKLYLVDFGSALCNGNAGRKEGLTGTPGYAAPECYRGEAEVRSDIYSAGKLLTYMISENRAGTLKRWERKKLDAVAAKACREKPADRYRDADAMKKALEGVQKHGGRRRKSCVVGLAGSGRRMGVTYFALACAAFAKRQGERVLYLECNESAMAQQVSEKAEKQKGDGLFVYHGIEVAECRTGIGRDTGSGYSVDNETEYYKNRGYSVIFADFGVLTTENLKEFASADYCLFFAGEKDWELENTWRGLARLSGLEEKLLLLLYGSSEKGLRAFSRQLPGLSCRRVPFVNGMEDRTEKEVMQALMAEVLEQSALL